MTQVQATAASRWPQRARWSNTLRRYGAAIALLILVLLNAFFTPNFATAANFWNILLQVSTTAIVAVGMTFVILTGGVDLSVGSVMALAAAVAAVSFGEHSTLVAVLLALGTAAAVGALNGFLISQFKIQPIVITLAALIYCRGLAQVVSRGGQLITFSNPGFETLGRGSILGVPTQILLMLAVVGIAIFVLRYTVAGRSMLAVGGNEAAARLAGVPVRLAKITVYVAASLLAGVAGLIEAARLSSSDAARIGLNVELDAIAAVVIGGTPLSGGRATIVGTVIGALLMQVITTTFNMRLLPYSWALVLKAIIILVAVYIQRQENR